MNEPVAVVSDAGPLMVLAKLNALDLLREMYGRVHFAASVYQEVVLEGMRLGYPDARRLHVFLSQAGWQPEDLAPEMIPTTLGAAQLDPGERDTLGLALQHANPLVLMDEVEGRRTARRLGLPVRGSLGILVESYRQQLIDENELRFHMAEISRREDIWISSGLVQRLLVDLFGADRP